MQTSSLQLWLSIGMPSFLVLVGILLNQQGIHRVKGRIDETRDELLSRIDHLSTRLDNLFTMVAGHGAQIARLEERNNK